jgi:hypothetical protein
LGRGLEFRESTYQLGPALLRRILDSVSRLLQAWPDAQLEEQTEVVQIAIKEGILVISLTSRPTRSLKQSTL